MVSSSLLFLIHSYNHSSLSRQGTLDDFAVATQQWSKDELNKKLENFIAESNVV